MFFYSYFLLPLYGLHGIFNVTLYYFHIGILGKSVTVKLTWKKGYDNRGTLLSIEALNETGSARFGFNDIRDLKMLSRNSLWEMFPRKTNFIAGHTLCYKIEHQVL